jgi:carboxyl-terminal processing protease
MAGMRRVVATSASLLLAFGSATALAQRTLEPKVAAPVLAEKRVALVIGNAAYERSPLRNPVNDARAIADRLQRLGFTVVRRDNMKAREIGAALREFRSKLSPGAVALFFYAGHGMQVRGANYLPAVDADIEAEEDVPNQSLNVAQVIELMEDAKARVNLVFLDACRDNPFARKFRSASRGLARIDTTASGILISFATRPGSVASDGEGKNGLYTEHLIRHMETPGLPIEQVLKRVGADVKVASKGRQEPWSEGLIEGDFYFRGGGAQLAAPAVPAPMATQVAAVARSYGSLSVSSRASGVEIWVNGNRAGEAGSGLDLLVNNLEEGVHQITARKGRRLWEQEVKVAANDRHQVNVHIDAQVPGLSGDLLNEILARVDAEYYVSPDHARFFAGALQGLRKAAPDGALSVAGTNNGVALVYRTSGNATARLTFETPTRGDLVAELQVAARLARDVLPSIDPIRAEKMLLTSALEALDVHSSFLDAEEFKELQVGTQGAFGGVGMEVGLSADKQLQVVSPIDGTPAQRAGLLPRDIVVTVDGLATRDKPLHETVKRLRGFPGSEVRLEVLRTGWSAPREFVIRREIIRVVSVKQRMLEPGVAYVSIRSLQEQTPLHVQSALEQMQSAGMRALVLDLRNCPGGLLKGAVQVASRFTEAGKTVVSTAGRSKEASMTLTSERGKAFVGFPIAVLVNEGSASGCEIIAGALQDWKVAAVIGNRTFGKGTVQTIHPLKGGAALKLTTAEYRTASGRQIDKVGIEPDLLEPAAPELQLDPATDIQLHRAVAHLKTLIR